MDIKFLIHYIIYSLVKLLGLGEKQEEINPEPCKISTWTSFLPPDISDQESGVVFIDPTIDLTKVTDVQMTSLLEHWKSTEHKRQVH